jgi:5-hydroxyisourate hydrolase
MSSITTHILDISIGRPAQGVAVVLEVQQESEWKHIGTNITDNDGRIRSFLTDDTLFEEGIYRLTFDTESYFAANSVEAFYPHVSITFTISDGTQHFHVPLLVSPFGYSTYRGS